MISRKILNEKASQLSDDINIYYDTLDKFNKVSGSNVDSNLADEVIRYNLKVKTGFYWFICNGYSKAIETWMTKFNNKGIQFLDELQ